MNTIQTQRLFKISLKRNEASKTWPSNPNRITQRGMLSGICGLNLCCWIPIFYILYLVFACTFCEIPLVFVWVYIDGTLGSPPASNTTLVSLVDIRAGHADHAYIRFHVDMHVCVSDIHIDVEWFLCRYALISACAYIFPIRIALLLGHWYEIMALY